MDHIGFLIVSIVEYIGMLSIMLAVYRFEIKYHYIQMIFIAFICSILSHVLFIGYQNSYAPIIQLVALVILVRFVLQVQLFYAAVMAVSVILVYSTAQGIIIWVWATLSGDKQESIPVTSPTMYSIQIVCALICMGIAWKLQRNRIGVTFIPTSINDQFFWTKTNKLLLSIVGISFLVLWEVVYLVYIETQFRWFLVLSSILAAMSAVLIFMIRRKDRSDD